MICSFSLCAFVAAIIEMLPLLAPFADQLRPSSPQAIPPPAPLCQTTVGCWVNQMTGHMVEGFSRQAMMEKKKASRENRSGVVKYLDGVIMWWWWLRWC